MQPVIERYEREYLESLGYVPMWVSVFDHWLSPEESNSSPILSYNISLSANRFEEYRVGEEKFIDFYATIIKDNVVLNLQTGVAHNSMSDSIQSVILDSLRETRLMDIFIENSNIRVLGGYDRTDIILLSDILMRNEIIRAAIDSGLKVLD
jgi:hypothetical protein